MADAGVGSGIVSVYIVWFQASGDSQMDQAFARAGFGYVEGLNFRRDLAGVIVDAGFVLLWDVDHCG